MDVNDYLIDIDGLDWKALLPEWRSLIPSGTAFGPWLMNRLGDVFWFDELEAVNLLSPTEGTTRRLAASEDEFLTVLNDDDRANDWLMIQLLIDFGGERLAPGSATPSKRCRSWAAGMNRTTFTRLRSPSAGDCAGTCTANCVTCPTGPR
jgi:hypothetical protein